MAKPKRERITVDVKMTNDVRQLAEQKRLVDRIRRAAKPLYFACEDLLAALVTVDLDGRPELVAAVNKAKAAVELARSPFRP